MTELIKKIALSTGLDQPSVIRIMQGAPVRYKTYFIPKRNGDKRKISQPAREVKLLQRALVEVLLERLPIHASAMAYRKNTSIRDNAIIHAKSGPILKIDFKDFFTSIKRIDWVNFCKKTGCLTDNSEVYLTASLLFQKQRGVMGPRLAIGAPSSPILSNILLYEFDTLIENALEDKNILYSRYADDLTFSAPRTGYLHEVHDVLKLVLRDLESPKLKINTDKTTYATAKYQRRVTGLILSNDGRVTIGRANKRSIHASVHHASLGKLNKEELTALAGMLSFVKSVEPDFIRVLSKKYGSNIIEEIKKNSGNRRTKA